MPDFFPRPQQQNDPAVGAIPINYSGGDQALTVAGRGVHIDTAGALKVDMVDGTTVTFATLNAGQFYPYRIRKIYQTGSTAAGSILT
jgi:hypothetical protein